MITFSGDRVRGAPAAGTPWQIAVSPDPPPPELAVPRFCGVQFRGVARVLVREAGR